MFLNSLSSNFCLIHISLKTKIICLSKVDITHRPTNVTYSSQLRANRKIKYWFKIGTTEVSIFLITDLNTIYIKDRGQSP